ncbi:ImmA/IrrE family metallo-endopeptidase [Paraburkholderia tropica]|uniref:ImmA/IrrE family metallo-endopeptidase n=1 Tax=Paraburkholderia tropica TaxID=92647 RepID=UPI0032B3EA54
MNTKTSTTRVGDELEKRIFDLIQTEINADRFFFGKQHCKVFTKKGYYSRDRCSNIIFDVSIEAYLPGAQEYSMLILIECKNYSHPVPVDDAEEFFAKLQQVGAANAKGIIASPAAFQSGAREFAKSKGMGLLRYFDAENFKWELRRSPSASVRAHTESSFDIEQGLSSETFQSSSFDLYLQGQNLSTNSLWDFLSDLTIGTNSGDERLRDIVNQREDICATVAYLSKDGMEDASAAVLNDLGYRGGEVSLSDLCDRESRRHGLSVRQNVIAPSGGTTATALGRIVFDPLEIEIYAQTESNRGRERFTLAHELAHHLLDHGRYLIRESCDGSDFLLQNGGIVDETGLIWLEYQANYMASSLLMPKPNLIKDFQELLQNIGVWDRGFGMLYLDEQPCNLQNYLYVTARLMAKYGVSRSAVHIRLESLKLVNDHRRRPTLVSAGSRW